MIRLTAVIEVEGHAPRALTHESNARTIVMGRDASSDFQLPLATISRHHARISENDSVYTIEDLGSSHGTAINGKRLESGQKKVLRNGDVIELTKAKVTCSIEIEKVASIERGEGTQAIAARAVQGILGRLGESKGDGPYLRVLNGTDENVRFQLSGALMEWTLGRSKDCECVLNDANVSRRHATVKKDWNGFIISDLGSKNGVLVNDRAISRPRRLKDRDEITVGPIRLVFVDPDADLLDALKDVPGFEIEDPEPEPMDEIAPSVVGTPESGGIDGELPISSEPGPPPGLDDPAEEEADEFTNLDPDLLEPAEGKRGEWVGITIGAVLGIAAIVVAVVVLLM